MTRNSRTRAYLNPDLASRIGFRLPSDLADEVTVIGEETSETR